MWKKLIDSEDCIGFEKNNKNLSIRIEARKGKDSWNIFKTYYNNKGLSFTEEYYSETKVGAEQLIIQLQSKKQPSIKEVKNKLIQQQKKVNVNLSRSFRDYTVEKWNFTIDRDKSENLIYIRDADVITVDIIMHRKYKSKEIEIISTLKKILGLKGNDMEIQQSIYYYNNNEKRHIPGNKKEIYLGKIDFGLSDED